MTIYSDETTVRARGRPSVRAERHEQIVNAFIELVADRGTTAVPVADVARRCGLARTALRHFVGNRADLIEHAVIELVDRYRAMIDAAVGPDPHPTLLVDMLFDHGWVHERPVEDRAFDVLVLEAKANRDSRVIVAGAFAHLIDALSTAFHTHGAPGTREELDGASYSIVCLSEQNVALQALGFDPERSHAAADAAKYIATSTLGASPRSASDW